MDKDDDNKGGEYREDGVDIVKAGDGYAIGYTQEGEWLEYTVDVTAAGEYGLTFSYATSSENTGAKLYVDDNAVKDDIVFPQGADWETYTTLDAGKVTLAAGKHVLKLEIVGNYVNIDWLAIGAPASADTSATTRIAGAPVQRTGLAVFDVFGVTGKYVASFVAHGTQGLRERAAASVDRSGVYMVKPRHGGQTLRISIQKQ